MNKVQFQRSNAHILTTYDNNRRGFAIVSSLLWHRHYDITIMTSPLWHHYMPSLLWYHYYDITIMTSLLWHWHHYYDNNKKWFMPYQLFWVTIKIIKLASNIYINEKRQIKFEYKFAWTTREHVDRIEHNISCC